jgi:cell division septation protein DedD
MRQEQLRLFKTEDDASAAAQRKMILIPLDTLVLLAVVVLLLFVVSFSLGVERGRKATFNVIERSKQTDIAKDTLYLDMITPKNTVRNTMVQTETNKPVGSKVVSAAQNITTANEQRTKIITAKEQKTLKGYYIQIGTYNNEAFAHDEAKKIQDKGFPTTVTRKGNFFILYVGSYNSEQEAQKALGSLKRIRKDCILRVFK